jgi:hypothetical protein
MQDNQRHTYVLEGTLTATQPLATCSLALKETVAKGAATPVPTTTTPQGTRLMFPATGIRGKLRRALRDVLRNQLIKRTGNEKPLSLDEHYMLTLGGIKASGAEDRSTVAMEAEWREKNPLLSLFGAGAGGVLGFVSGRLNVGNAICNDAMDPIVFSGARTDDLFRNKEQVNFLSDADIQSLIGRSKGNRDASVIKNAIKIKEKELRTLRKTGSEAAISALELEIANLALEKSNVQTESGSGDVSVGMPLSGWNAIPSGAEMNQTMMIARGTLTELGALLAALEEFSLLPVLGAHFAAGCGMVSGSWEVFQIVRGQGKVSLGTVNLTLGAIEIVAGPSSLLHEARAQFSTYLGSEHFDISIPRA